MAETTRPVPVSEIGYVNPSPTDWQQWDYDERVPDLQWPESNHVYYRMAREDGRVASVLQAIGLPIRRTAWRIDPNGAPDEVVEHVAGDMNLPIAGSDDVLPARRRDRFSWSLHLQHSLSMLKYGHAFFEQVYRMEGDGNARRYHLRKLAPRPQKTISKFNVALDGGLISIEQEPPASDGRTVWGINPLAIGIDRLVAYVLDPEPGDWSGSTLLRPAYKHWILKDELMRIQAAAARRNGMGVPVGTAAPGGDDAEVKEMRKLAMAYRGGSSSGVGLANGQDLKLLGVQGNLPDIQQAIDYQDKQIALAGLAHFLNLDRSGSYAMASVQADTFVQSVQTFAELIRDVTNQHVIEDLVDINFGADVAAPRLVFDEIGSRQDATAAALAMLVQAGLLQPDDVLRIKVRQQLGLPVESSEAADTGADDGGAA